MTYSEENIWFATKRRGFFVREISECTDILMKE